MNETDNRELIAALDELEKEKEISKDIILEAIENSLLAACKDHFGKSDNINVIVDRYSGEVKVFAVKTIVEEVTDDTLEVSLDEIADIYPDKVIGDTIDVVVTPKNFGRIAAQKAKQVVVQKIREEERKVIYNQYYEKERDIITGIVQRVSKGNISVDLGKIDTVLTESEQVKTEHFRPTERIKLYVVEVKDTAKGPRITVSRTHPEFVKRLFEYEVAEVQDGTVEIKSIAREAGSRTKMAVYSYNPDVDPVGACVGINGIRVNAIVDELRGEKIDIINWSDDPATLIENALSPAKVISVEVDEEEKSANVVVPDFQLSLAIGKEGQNARLAARLTGYKIDIKSETQAKDAPGFRYEDYMDGDYEDDYEEGEYGEAGYGDGNYEEAGYEDGNYGEAGYEEGEYVEAASGEAGYEEGEYGEAGYEEGEYVEAASGEGEYEEAGYGDAGDEEGSDGEAGYGEEQAEDGDELPDGEQR